MNNKKPTQEEIIKKLTEKVNNQPIKCSICNKSNFTILDKFINQPVMDEISGNFIIESFGLKFITYRTYALYDFCVYGTK